MNWEVIHGDALEVMAGMPDASVDGIVTDPPYKDYETNRYDASAHHHPVKAVDPNIYAPHLWRVLKNDSALLLWLTWEYFESHRIALERVGFETRNRIVWGKPNHTAGDLEGNLGNQYEEALFAVKGNWKRHGKRETNLWLEPHLFSRDYRHHATEKPVGLMCRSVRLVAPAGSVILDPFCGSGSTGVGCVSERRGFIGIETDAHDCEVARARISRASGVYAEMPPKRNIVERSAPLLDSLTA